MALLLLAAFAGNAVWSARAKSVTVDEYVFISEGYHYLRTGDYLYDAPLPLALILAGAPLLGADVELPPRGRDRAEFADRFVFQNRIDSDALVFRARLPTLVLGMLLGSAVFAWARRLYGPAAGLVALALYATSPNLLAHSSLATADLPLTCFSFLGFYAGYRYAERGTRGWLVLAGASIGLALASKLSALGLLPFLLSGLGAIEYRRGAGSAAAPRLARSLVAMASALAIASAGLVLAYGFVNLSAFAAAIQHHLSHLREGHHAYLMGERSMRGWLAYFPIAFGIKTPLALFGLLALALWRLPRDPLRLRVAACVLLAPVVIFFVGGMASSLQIGLRHMLPAYPFLFVFASSAVQALPGVAGRALCGALVAWFALSGIRAAPDHLAYFNEAIGGPEHGPEYLLDSNVDWGQDVKAVGQYLRDQGIERVHVEMFRGCRNFPELRCQRLRCRPTPGHIAISVNALYGLTEAQALCHAWLRRREPVARIGGSIYVYSVDGDPAGPPAATPDDSACHPKPPRVSSS